MCDAGSTAEQGTLTPDAALVRLFAAPHIDSGWFATTFLEAVSVEKVRAIVRDLTTSLGAVKQAEKTTDGYRVSFANGTLPAKIGLDAQGRIKALWFSPSEPASAPPLEKTAAEFAALPGKVAIFVTTNGKADVAVDADAPLAVGSAFKLAILAALRELVDAKKLAWAQVATLRAEHKSLPSGFLQTWPDGAPLALHTLASLMISQSDNTAADVLLDLAGRDAVEKLAPGNAPFLSTRDAFVLKATANAPLLEQWRKADTAGKRRLLDALRTAALLPFSGVAGPTALDVEWRISARHLCELATRTSDLPMMRINSGVASAKDWDSIAFKGGSEPGVLNLTTSVEKDGKQHCVVATWNDDKDLDEPRFVALYRALLQGVRAR
jgi:beta-lactamase class A